MISLLNSETKNYEYFKLFNEKDLGLDIKMPRDIKESVFLLENYIKKRLWMMII